jgi:hypothetical protein
MRHDRQKMRRAGCGRIDRPDRIGRPAMQDMRAAAAVGEGRAEEIALQSGQVRWQVRRQILADPLRAVQQVHLPAEVGDHQIADQPAVGVEAAGDALGRQRVQTARRAHDAAGRRARNAASSASSIATR